jgi:hypothetical protein
MELLAYVRKIWLRTHSKGKWETKDGTEMYVEELTDNHLMRIPHFLFKMNSSMVLDVKRWVERTIPDEILEEIEERNMYIDYDNECKVRRNHPALKAISSKPNIARKKTHNKIFYR